VVTLAVLQHDLEELLSTIINVGRNIEAYNWLLEVLFTLRMPRCRGPSIPSMHENHSWKKHREAVSLTVRLIVDEVS